jgi:hypothetical protein
MSWWSEKQKIKEKKRKAKKANRLFDKIHYLDEFRQSTKCTKYAPRDIPRSLLQTLGGKQWTDLHDAISAVDFKVLVRISSKDETISKMMVSYDNLKMVIISQRFSKEHIGLFCKWSKMADKDSMSVIASFVEDDYVDSYSFECVLLKVSLKFDHTCVGENVIPYMWDLIYRLKFYPISNAVKSIKIDFVQLAKKSELMHLNCNSLGEYLVRRMPFDCDDTFYRTEQLNLALITLISDTKTAINGIFELNNDSYQHSFVVNYLNRIGLEAISETELCLHAKLNALFEKYKDNSFRLKIDHILVKKIWENTLRGFTDGPYPLWDGIIGDYKY